MVWKKKDKAWVVLFLKVFHQLVFFWRFPANLFEISTPLSVFWVLPGKGLRSREPAVDVLRRRAGGAKNVQNGEAKKRKRSTLKQLQVKKFAVFGCFWCLFVKLEKWLNLKTGFPDAGKCGHVQYSILAIFGGTEQMVWLCWIQLVRGYNGHPLPNKNHLLSSFLQFI